MESEMRGFVLSALACLALAGMVPEASAAAAGVPRVEAGSSPNIVQVDRRCGPRAHFVPRHRARDGRMIRGHCVRNRR
jgi:hypothetical protein